MKNKVKPIIAILLIGIAIIYMFTLFNKKFKDINDYPDTWSIAQGTRENKPMFVRFRDGLKDATGHPAYPFQIGIAIPLLNPTEDGLTNNAEADELGKIEDVLVEKLTEKNRSVFAMIITFNGMREFVFYASKWEPEIFERDVKSINSGNYELQFMMKQDPKWDTFKQLTTR